MKKIIYTIALMSLFYNNVYSKEDVNINKAVEGINKDKVSEYFKNNPISQEEKTEVLKQINIKINNIKHSIENNSNKKRLFYGIAGTISGVTSIVTLIKAISNYKNNLDEAIKIATDFNTPDANPLKKITQRLHQDIQKLNGQLSHCFENREVAENKATLNKERKAAIKERLILNQKTINKIQNLISLEEANRERAQYNLYRLNNDTNLIIEDIKYELEDKLNQAKEKEEKAHQLLNQTEAYIKEDTVSLNQVEKKESQFLERLKEAMIKENTLSLNLRDTNQQVKDTLTAHFKKIAYKHLGFSITSGIATYYLLKHSLCNSNAKKDLAQLEAIKNVIQNIEAI